MEASFILMAFFFSHIFSTTSCGQVRISTDVDCSHQFPALNWARTDRMFAHVGHHYKGACLHNYSGHFTTASAGFNSVQTLCVQ